MKIKKDRISKLYSKRIGADVILAKRDKCKRLFNLYEQYCFDDGETTLKIYHEQLKRAEELGMTKIIKMYNKYLLSLIFCMNSGIKVDLDRCQKTLRDFKLKEVELLRQAEEFIKDFWTDERLPEFNINSPQHKSAILFGGNINVKVRRPNGYFKNGKEKFKIRYEVVPINGFNLPKTLTQESKIKGRYQTGTDIINKIYKKSSNKDAKKYCGLQKEAMNHHKMANTYLKAFLELNIDGLLYPNFNTTKTSTSRLSSSNPNMQNCPSKGEMAKHIQSLFIAPSGWKCVQIDFSQLEIYVLAWLSGGKVMTKDLLDGICFHCWRLSWCPSLCEGKSYEEIYDLAKTQGIEKWVELRSKAKTISYRKAYGGGAKSLAEATELDEEEVKKILDQEDRTYSTVKSFNDYVYSQVENNQEPSLAKHLPAIKKKGGINGKRFSSTNAQGRPYGVYVELLPIYKHDGSLVFTKDAYRRIGYYQTITGKRYAFEDFGQIDKRGRFSTRFSPTQTKNYHIQGTAGDIQAATSAALLPLLLEHSDKVKLINEIHDSKWFYIKEEYLEQLLNKICDIMESIPKNYLNIEVPFKFPVDAEVGDDFANLKPFKRSSHD
jgi:DNA polymerase I-like protein with 3'-5' exonuclease and polymerase domains